MVNVPRMKLNNGEMMPVLGLGTWQAEPGKVGEAVKLAIDLGYRHFDCAMIYQNEAEVGAALREKISDGSVARKDLFIGSKLWNTFHKPNLVIPACKKSLENFGLGYLDLYLIHWPFAFQEHKECFPRDQNGKILFADYDFVETWKEMEKCVEQGLVKSIGVSNFNAEQMSRLVKNSKIKPVTNQVECHPYLNQKKLTEFCKSLDITITAYSPLGSPSRPWARPEEPVLLEDSKILEIAGRIGKTPGQVVLKYLVHLGVIPIPKSTNKQRLIDNIKIFEFDLSQSDIATLDSLDCNGRLCFFRDAKEHKEYPFNIEY